jgi:Fic-DOC domain mobile mystery protein B
VIHAAPEGATPLSPDETEGLKFDHVTTRGELDELEQANILEGLSWQDQRRRRRLDVLDDAFVRLLHKKLFGHVWTWAGTYRLREKNIGIAPVLVPTQVRVLLDDARYWALNRIFSALEAGARFHHRLVQIHPFPNGNGRHARIMTDALLQDYFEHPGVQWSDGFDLQNDTNRRSQYILALRKADAGDFSLLLKFVGA